MRRTSKNDLKNTSENKSSVNKNSAPKKQTGMFQIFDLKEARKEEIEAEERAKELEREEAERQAAALKERMTRMESSYAKKQKEQKPLSPQVERTIKRKPLSQEVKKRRPQTAPVLPKATPDPRNAAMLNRTLDSSRNFSSVHSAARKIQSENSTVRTVPKAELQGMDTFWAELEAAKKREAEEYRQREIKRARQQELEKARLQEAAIARLREEETRKRREEEEERQRALELKRQNEAAAEKWRAEEAARVKAEADRMREIQILKRREEEAERVKQLEVAKIREAQVNRVRMEEEENIRRELARFQQEKDQHIRIENILEETAAEYEVEGARLREAEQEELQQELSNKMEAEEVPEKEQDTFDDFVFEIQEPADDADADGTDVEAEEEDTEADVDGTDVEAEEEDTEADVDGTDVEADAEDTDVDADDSDADTDGTDVEADAEDTDVDADDSDADTDDTDEDADDDDADDDDADDDDADDDDFDEEITFGKSATRKSNSKAFVLPSFGKIMDAEKPREARKARIPRQPEGPDQGLDAPKVQEKINAEVNSADSAVDISTAVKEENAAETKIFPDVDEIESFKEAILKHESLLKEGTNKKSLPHHIYNRKRFDAMLGKILAGTLIAVMVINAVLPDKASSETENRELQQVPAVDTASIMDGNFASEVENWQSDQFVGRDILRNMQMFLSWLGGDREENGVYFGKNGQLLEEIVKPETELLQSTVSAMNAFADQYPDKRYVMMLVPDAGTILNDSYPSYAEKNDQRGYAGTLKSMLSEKYQWVDVFGALDSHSGEKLYYKTDHHWTSLGAYYGYQAYCEALGFQVGNYSVNTISASFNGVLSSSSGFCQGEKETIEMYVPEAQTKVVVTNSDNGSKTATLYDKDKLNTKDQYAVFLGGNNSLLDIKTTTDTDQVLLLFKDSFANCMMPLLVTQYKEILVVDPRYYYGDIQELMLAYGVTDVTFLYSGNTFFADHNLQGTLSQQ